MARLGRRQPFAWQQRPALSQVIVEATGAVTGTGTVAASATVTVNATGALSGAGVFAGTAIVGEPATGAVSGSGTFAATALVTVIATGAISGTGTFAASATGSTPGQEVTTTEQHAGGLNRRHTIQMHTERETAPDRHERETLVLI